MKIDKQNGNVAFAEDTHTYWNVDDNAKYISVTTLIEQYGQPFDKDFWSAYKALEKLIPKESWSIEKKSLLSTKKFNKKLLDLYEISEDNFNKAQQDILDEWDKTNREACERGTKIHAELENSFYTKKKNISLSKYEIGGKFECIKGHTELDMENGVYPEYLISRMSDDGILRIAGQIDLLVKNGNEITIGDWKGLPLDTEIPTLTGWTTIADIKVGDKIFDKLGNSTTVIHKSEIHNNPCYKITFDNSESIIADCDHRWEISFMKQSKKNKYVTTVMTTKELYNYLQSIDRNSYTIPKIINCSPLQLPEKDLPIDPYVLGCWLGDGSKSCGAITNETNNVLQEINKRGYTLGKDISGKDRTESHTILNIYGILKQLNLLNNKHIPDIYQRASYKQRLDLLRGLMDTDGYYNAKRKRFVMETSQDWQRDDFIKLLSSLGIKTTTFEIIKKLNGKKFSEHSINFSTNGLNPFLSRNQDIDFPKSDKNSFRNINSVEFINTVPTQCLEVDSPTHTFLCTKSMIVTHNTNKEIKQHSGFDTVKRTNAKMLYPLNNLDDCNFYHYTLQLSTYAWMIQKLNPNYVIKDLVLVHFDHDDNMTVYHLDYLKSEVERMLTDYKKKLIRERQKEKRKRIEY